MRPKGKKCTWKDTASPASGCSKCLLAAQSAAVTLLLKDKNALKLIFPFALPKQATSGRNRKNLTSKHNYTGI